MLHPYRINGFKLRSAIAAAAAMVAAPPPPPPPLDTDGDGIPDASDPYPNDPTNTPPAPPPAPAWSPTSLYTSSQEGFWYDPSDLSTLFQDTAGTIPVTATGQPVARVNDKSGKNRHWVLQDSATGTRPTLVISGGLSYLDFDGVDDALLYMGTMPTGSLDVFLAHNRDGTAKWVPFYGDEIGGDYFFGVHQAATGNAAVNAGTPTYHVDGAAVTMTGDVRQNLITADTSAVVHILEARGVNLSGWPGLGFGKYFDGWLFDGKFFGAVGRATLSTTERAELYAWLNGKVGRSSSGAERYMRSGAAAGGDGTSWATAWNSFSQAAGVSAGTTIYIAGGSTFGPTTMSFFGTQAKPIKFLAATNASHGTSSGWNTAWDAATNPVVFDGGGTAGKVLAFGGSSWVTLDGQVRGVNLESGYGIQVKNGAYAVSGDNGSGCTGLTLRYLDITTLPLSSTVAEDGIQGKGDDLTVECCYIHGNDSGTTHGDGIQWFEGSRIKLLRNVWKDNGQQIYLGEGTWNMVCRDVTIAFNLIYNRTGGHYNGIVINGAGSAAGEVIRIHHNTFDLAADWDDGFDTILYPYYGDASIEFKNNAFRSSGAGAINWAATHTYNAWDNSSGAGYNSSNPMPSSVGAVFQMPAEATGVFAAELGFQVVAPVSALDFRPVSGSPLINAGTNLGYTTDIRGNPVDSTPDIGCFQYVASEPTGGSGSDPANTYYVGPAATGVGDGSNWGNVAAWSSVTLARGNTYYLKAGSYPNRTLATANVGTSVIKIKKATAADHGTNTGWNAAYGTGAAIFGTENVGTPFTINTGYWEIDGNERNEADWFDTTAYGIRINYAADGRCVDINGTANNNIKIRRVFYNGCPVQASNGKAPYAIDTEGMTVIATGHEYTHSLAYRGTNVWFVRMTTGCLIEYNATDSQWSRNTADLSYHGELVNMYFNVTELTFRYNKCRNSFASGNGGTALIAICADNTAGAPKPSLYCYGNVFERFWTGDAAIGFGGNASYDGDASNCRIYNNTFVDGGEFNNGIAFPDGSGNVVQNNIWINCNVGISAGSGATVSHNAFSGSTSIGTNVQNGLTTAIFVDYANKDLRLATETAAGTTLAAPYNTDMLGTTRGQGVWDRGAYEKV